MKLPVSFEQFEKDPVKGLLFILIAAVGYLYIDSRMMNSKLLNEYKDQANNCISEQTKLQKQLKTSDSTLAWTVAELTVLLNNQ